MAKKTYLRWIIRGTALALLAPLPLKQKSTENAPFDCCSEITKFIRARYSVDGFRPKPGCLPEWITWWCLYFVDRLDDSVKFALNRVKAYNLLQRRKSTDRKKALDQEKVVDKGEAVDQRKTVDQEESTEQDSESSTEEEVRESAEDLFVNA